MSGIRLQSDFNGLFGEWLCLSHAETCLDANGEQVEVREGMTATVFDEDVDDDGNPDNLIATGTVQRPPDWLQCAGSRWALKIDGNGVRHESDLSADA